MIMNVPSNGEVKRIKDTLGYTAKNLLKNNDTSRTINGVTYTVNDDMSITLNGTLSAHSTTTINSNFNLPNGEYILSGCPEGRNDYIELSIGSEIITDVGNGAKFVVNNEVITSVKLKMQSASYDNVTFYPMIRKADITDDTYEPYAPSVDVRLDAAESALKSALEWKLVKEVTGATKINYPSEFKELKVVSYYTGENGSCVHIKCITKDDLSLVGKLKDGSNVINYITITSASGGITDPSKYYALWDFYATYVNPRIFMTNSNVSSSAKTRLYYR